MSNNELIRFWDKDINEMSKEELHDEERVQKHLRAVIKRELNALKKKEATSRYYIPVRLNKIDFFEMYVHELDGLIAEIEERTESLPHNRGTHTYRKRHDRNYKYLDVLAQDGIGISWDRDRFMLVARDRGYLSEQSITAALSKELNMELYRVKTLLKYGRFTWGQVMCMGAMLKMNPKEFCDIFMSGYFEEYYGEYIASYKNIDKSELLKRATVARVKE